MTALVVDDSFIIRNILKNVLEESKADSGGIREAKDGEEALHILNTETIGLLLVDWNMPKMNGLELVKKVRAMDKYKVLPIIMVTSEAAKYNVLEAVKAGVTDYVIKPIKGTVLIKKINQFVDIG